MCLTASVHPPPSIYDAIKVAKIPIFEFGQIYFAILTNTVCHFYKKNMDKSDKCPTASAFFSPLVWTKWHRTPNDVFVFCQTGAQIWTNIFCALGKYIQFWQMCLSIWSTIIYNIEKWILIFGQIDLPIWTIISGKFDLNLTPSGGHIFTSPFKFTPH